MYKVIFLSLIVAMTTLAVGCDSRESSLLVKRGREYYLQKRYAEAQEQLEAAVRKDSKNAIAYHILSQINKENGHLDEAITTQKMAADIDSKNADYAFDLAQLYELNAEHASSSAGYSLLVDKAIATYKDAIKRDSNYYRAYTRLAYLLERLQLWTEAAQNYHKAIEVNTGNIRAYLDLAKFYIDRDYPEAAVQVLQNVKTIEVFDSKLKRDKQEAQITLAMALRRNDQLEEALAEYNELLKDPAPYVEGYYEMAKIYYMMAEGERYKDAGRTLKHLDAAKASLNKFEQEGNTRMISIGMLKGEIEMMRKDIAPRLHL